MDKAAIEARLADLRAGLATLRDNYNATQGAIQECEYWLGKLAEPVTIKAVPQDSGTQPPQ